MLIMSQIRQNGVPLKYEAVLGFNGKRILSEDLVLSDSAIFQTNLIYQQMQTNKKQNSVG